MKLLKKVFGWIDALFTAMVYKAWGWLAFGDPRKFRDDVPARTGRVEPVEVEHPYSFKTSAAYPMGAAAGRYPGDTSGGVGDAAAPPHFTPGPF